MSLALASLLAAAAAAEPLLTVPVQAVRVADDDGGRASPVTPAQAADWVSFADEVFAPAGVRFDLRPSLELPVLRNSLLNSMAGVSDKGWLKEKKSGNAVAALYPGKLLVLFRNGPAREPTGAAFSGADYDFIAMSGIYGDHCGHPHRDNLAHEIGHYLGLSHTFKGDPFGSPSEAESFFVREGRRREAFDGDGLSDTPADPGMREHECDRAGEVSIGGERFSLPRDNIMSYYDERRRLSPQQVALLRWVLQDRLSRRMAAPGNGGGASRVEAQAVLREGPGAAPHRVQSLAGVARGSWVADDHVLCLAERGGSLEFELTAPRAGRYRVILFATRAPDFGRLRAALDGTDLGQPYDAYAPMVMASGSVALGSADLEAGTHRLRLTVFDKNAVSTGYRFGVDAFELRGAAR